MTTTVDTKYYRFFETIFNSANGLETILAMKLIMKTEIQQNPAPYEIDHTMEDQQAELLQWYYCLGHAPFKTLRAMALLDMLPRHIMQARPSKCVICHYGAMTIKPWRTSEKGTGIKPTPIHRPGDCISIDQMESSVPGFVAQLKGCLTRKRYAVTTVFVDHYSRLKYVHPQTSTSAQDTLDAKEVFEAYTKKHGVMIHHYHADNGTFANNLFMKDAHKKDQDITYCGVNTHFQNGIAEKAIRDLQEQARKQLFHAKARWPEAIHLSL